MSFSVQALALEWLVKHRDGLEKKVYQVPAEIDDAIGRVKLAAMGLSIDALTPSRRSTSTAGRRDGVPCVNPAACTTAPRRRYTKPCFVYCISGKSR